jgi:hypothetical protein
MTKKLNTPYSLETSPNFTLYPRLRRNMKEPKLNMQDPESQKGILRLKKIVNNDTFIVVQRTYAH